MESMATVKCPKCKEEELRYNPDTQDWICFSCQHITTTKKLLDQIQEDKK